MVVPDFISHANNSPVLGGGVDGIDDLSVQTFTFFESLIQRDLTEFRTHGGHCNLGNCILVVLNAIRSLVSIQDAIVQDS